MKAKKVKPNNFTVYFFSILLSAESLAFSHLLVGIGKNLSKKQVADLWSHIKTLGSGMFGLETDGRKEAKTFPSKQLIPAGYRGLPNATFCSSALKGAS